MNIKKEFIALFLSINLIFFSLISCSKDAGVVTPNTTIDTGYQYTVPEQLNDGWQTASVTDVGMTIEPLKEMMDSLYYGREHKIHNVLIIKNNKLVFEEYLKGYAYRTDPPRELNYIIQYDRDMYHYLASVTKSVTSTLFGVAVKNGFIPNNMDEKITTFFPHYSDILIGNKANITVKHLLTMTSGLDWDETTYPYGDPRNDVTGMFLSSDPIRFVLSKGMHAPPGVQFHYNSGVTNVLAEIIRLQTNQNFLQYADANLFQPLGITNYLWERIHGNYYFASGGLHLRPRDLTKIGYAFLNNGVWNGQQIITQGWINASTTSYINPGWTGFANGYGYQWWMNTRNINGTNYDYFMAAGYGEQYMLVCPALDLILVFNGSYFGTPVTVSPFELIENYIEPALNL